MRNKKGAIEFSFGWIFAIVAGVFILVLAIYGVIKFVNLQKSEIDAETAKGIGILTNPFESGFESSARDRIVLPTVTRIYLDCDNGSIFGRQIISTSEKLSNHWSEENGGLTEVSFQNRYIFGKNPVEGKYFYMFSKPFEMPFKVGDLIYLTSSDDKYCFIDPPNEIEEELEDLIVKDEEGEVSEYENFILVNRKTDCPRESTKICFSGECDVYVSRNLPKNYVQKRSSRVYYEGDALMYAAIFSDDELYECQLDRLMNRTEQLFEIYNSKSKFIFQKAGCNSEMDLELIEMLALIKGFQNSRDIYPIYLLSNILEIKNEQSQNCKLW
ncbi:MAG: hypothetical protein ACP5NZ_05280 [Nanobdellota archaeon]